MRRLLLLIAGIMATASTVSAQEPGDLGLVMGYPASIGVVWHPTAKVAIRPSVSFAFNATELSTAIPIINPFDPSDAIGSETHTTSRQVGIGLSALFYLSKADGLSTYVSPRFSYGWGHSHTESTLSSFLDTESTNSTVSAGGFFGVQYALNPRFAVFGEVGADYSRLKPSSLAYAAGKATGVRSATDVGVVFYFGK